MFEQIQFSKIFQDQNFKDQDLHLPNKKYSSSEEMEYSMPAVKSADFNIKGSFSVINEQPISEANKQKYIYIQSFSYMNAVHSYFTHRKDYHSLLILFTYSGEGILIYKGNTYELTPGCCFLINCEEEHTYHLVGDYWEHSDLHIYGGMHSLFIMISLRSFHLFFVSRSLITSKTS